MPRIQSTIAWAAFSLIMVLLSSNGLVVDGQGGSCYVSGKGIRFRPVELGNPRSFFTAPFQTAEIERGKPFPRIIIQVVDSDGNVDWTKNGVVNVTVATSIGTLSPVGTSASIFRGEAHLTGLAVQSVGPIRLRFTAYNPAIPTPPFHNSSIETGTINVTSTPDPLYDIAFSPIRSLVQHEGEPVTFVSGQPLTEIRVLLLTSALVPASDTSNIQALVVQATMQNDVTNDGLPIILSGNTARIRVLDGVAVFSGLTITTTSADTAFSSLVFTLSANGKTLTVRTGPLKRTVVDTAFYDDNIAFDGAETSFIYSENQEASAREGVAFPPIRISLRDKTNHLSPNPFTGLIITATCDRAPLYGAVVGVVSGVATFDQLMFRANSLNNNDFQPFVITFTAGAQGGKGAKGKKLQTGVILVSAGPPVPAFSLRFRQNSFDSYFNAPDVDTEFSLFQPFPRPIQIMLWDSANQIDTNSTYQVAATVTDSTLDKVLSDAQFVKGVATFSNFQFMKKLDRPARMIFKTRVGDNILTLYTGEILLSVQVVATYDLQFQQFGASLITRPGQDLFATKDVPMAPIIIEVLSSVGQIERQSAEIEITATADNGAVLSNNYARSNRGVAIFDSLTFVSETPGTFRITFTAGTTSNTSVDGKRLITGLVTMTNVKVPSYRIRFNRTNSYIAFEGDTKPVTNGVPMPRVIAQLVDSTGNPANLDPNSRLSVSVTTTSGKIVSSNVEQRIVNGTAVFDGITIVDAFDPVLQFCVSNLNTGVFAPAEGQCISSGSLPFSSFPDPIAALTILNATQYLSDLSITSTSNNQSILSGASLRVAVAVLNSNGQPNGAYNYAGMKIQASSDYSLSGDVSPIPVDSLTGIALFTNLQLGGAEKIPVGVTPVITFSASFDGTTSTRRIKSISTGLLTVVGSGGRTVGVDVVAEILFDFKNFDFNSWRDKLCRRLNIESARIRRTRVALGKGADVDNSTINEDTISTQVATWQGTRVEFQFLDPLPSSRNTKSAADLAAFFVALKPFEGNGVGCATADLMLRRAYLKQNDVSCDWGIFDEQLLGARRCLETAGFAGYCQCYVPMFNAVGARCLGYSKLADLCLNTLTPQAQCQQPEIRAVCKLLEFPDAPRTELAGTGAFLFLALPPVLWLWYSGYFEKVVRPKAGKNRFQKLDFVARDATDHLT